MDWQILKLYLLLLLALNLFLQCSTEEIGCLKLNNVTNSEVEAVLPTTPVDLVSMPIKCYSKCVIKDYFNEKGIIDLKLVGNRARETELRVLSQCKAKHDHNFVDNNDDVRPNEKHCDYAYVMLQCLYLGPTNGTSIN